MVSDGLFVKHIHIRMIIHQMDKQRIEKVIKKFRFSVVT